MKKLDAQQITEAIALELAEISALETALISAIDRTGTIPRSPVEAYARQLKRLAKRKAELMRGALCG